MTSCLRNESSTYESCLLALSVDRDCINFYVSQAKFPNHFAFTLGHFMLYLVQFIGFVCRRETWQQLLFFKSKFSNHFAFTLGHFMLYLVQFIGFVGSVWRIETLHRLLCFKSRFPNHYVFTLGLYVFLLLFGLVYSMWMLTIVVHIQLTIVILVVVN